jgi:uncharacterized membrane protein YeaQ/YmgE (transglycosylase-associated protein family)
MNIVAFLLVGLIAGFLAGKIVEGHGFGPVGDIVVGIVGSFIGGFLSGQFLGEAYGFWGAVIMATLGSIILLVIAGLFTRGRNAHI